MIRNKDILSLIFLICFSVGTSLAGSMITLSSAAYERGINNIDVAKDIMIDNAGDVIVTGYNHNGTNYVFFTIKYSSKFSKY